MKHFSISFFFFLATTVFSQVCVPLAQAECPYTDEFKGAMCPDTLPEAYEGFPYESVVTIVPPRKYNHSVFGTVRVDSIRILSVTRKPAGISYSCTGYNCTFKGGYRYCIKIAGIPDSGTARLYHPDIYFKAWVTAYGFVDKIIYEHDSTLTFRVLKPSAIEDIKNESSINYIKYDCSENKLIVTSRKQGFKQVSIYDITGRTILSENIFFFENQKSEWSLERFSRGLYFATIQSNDENSYMKFIKN